MKILVSTVAACAAITLAFSGCSEDVGPNATGAAGPGPTGSGAGTNTGGGGGEGGIDLSDSGTPLTVMVVQARVKGT